MKKIKEAFKKFREDSLSKLFYDIAKWILGAIILFVSVKLFPDTTSFNEFLNVKLTLKIYWALFIVFFIVGVTLFLFSFLFSKKYRELEKIAYIDGKTGLNNHKLLESYLTEKMDESTKSGKPLSIILVDIDNFGSFNELYTPTIGDELITKLGGILGEDNRITDKVFRRYETGDEFVVICPDTTMTQAKYPAERKRVFIEEHTFLIEEKEHKATVCCGIAQFQSGNDTSKSFLDRANYAMRNITKKRPGKNCTEHAS